MTGLHGLQSLRGDWKSLDETGGAFCRYEWFEAYIRHLADAPDSIGFVSCRNARGPLAIVPAVPGSEAIRPFGELRAVTLGAHSHLTILDFPMAAHADPAMVGRVVIRTLKSVDPTWRVIRWRRSPVGGNAWRVLSALQGKAFARPGPASNGFDTTVPLETLQAAWSKNLRTSLQKSRKRLNEVQPWNVVSSRDGEVQRLFDEFLRLEASGWKGGSGTGSAIALNAGYRAFYDSLLKAAPDGLECEVTLLQTAGRAIAAQFSVTAQRCKHILKIGYDETAGRYSPGQVLLEEVLRRACADTSIDRVSLVTDMEWHKAWRPQASANFEGMIFRGPARRLAYRVCLATLPLARGLRQRLQLPQRERAPPTSRRDDKAPG